MKPLDALDFPSGTSGGFARWAKSGLRSTQKVGGFLSQLKKWNALKPDGTRSNGDDAF